MALMRTVSQETTFVAENSDAEKKVVPKELEGDEEIGQNVLIRKTSREVNQSRKTKRTKKAAALMLPVLVVGKRI